MQLVAEQARLRELHSYQVLDTPPDAELDELARAAARICDVPVALVSLVDRHRQYFKAHIGLDLDETPREGSFCATAIAGAAFFEVPDASQDERFRAHPMVTATPGLRFYAAAPLVTPGHAAIGTLCVIDWTARRLDRPQATALTVLAGQVVHVLERRRSALHSRTVRDALNSALRDSLRRIATLLPKLDGPAKDLISLCSAADAAEQILDDSVAALSPDARVELVRRKGDLGVVCGELVEALQQPELGRRAMFSSTGDCNGAWDLDRVSEALAALIEQALDGAEGSVVRVTARPVLDSVEIEIATQQAIEPRHSAAALRLAVARQTVEAHRGSLEYRREGGALAITLFLPRSGA